MSSLQRALPEAYGLDSRKISKFVDHLVNVEGMNLDGFMIYHRDAVIYNQWWWPAQPGVPKAIHSATKSLVALAAGFAVQEGKLKLTDKLMDYVQDEYKDLALAEYHRITLQDLLTMRSGHAVGSSGHTLRATSGSVIAKLLQEPVEGTTGETFVYSSGTSHLLSYMVHRAVGEPVVLYLKKRLFHPLGIFDFNWDADAEGINTGGNGLSFTGQDFLKIGIFLLQEGQWEGEQLLNKEWVRAQTTTQVPVTGDSVWKDNAFVPVAGDPKTSRKYGYQTWVSPDETYSELAGIFGQYCFVHPQKQMVIAVTGSIGNWRHRDLPQVFDDHFFNQNLELSETLTTDGLLERHREVASREFVHDFAPAQPVSARVKPMKLSGTAEENPYGIGDISVELDQHGVTFILTDERGRHRIASGIDRWNTSVTSLSSHGLHHSYEFSDLLVQAYGYVDESGVIRIRAAYPQTSFIDNFEIHPEEGGAFQYVRSTEVNTSTTELAPLRVN